MALISVMQYDARMQQRSTPKAPKPSGTRITITLPPDDYGHVLQLAKQKRVSASWVVRDAVSRYLADDMPLFAAREGVAR